MPELKLGYQGEEYYPWYDWAFKYARSYNFLLGKRDRYFGGDEKRFVEEMQRRLNASGVSGIVIDGKFGDRTAAAVGYKWSGTSAPPVVTPRRKIWITSSPGSGADAELGPSHDLGERCRDVLNLNHVMMRFPKGGYFGFLGGDPGLSYDEVIYAQYKAIESWLDNCADAQEAMRLARAYIAERGWREADLTDAQLIEVAAHLEFEHHHSGYSQSAQGVEEGCEMLYGDGGFVHPGDPTQTPSAPGRYRLIRHTLKLIVNFGNPSTPVTGIARKVRSPWLARKVRNVNYDNDFYAKVPLSDEIRPAMYRIIVKAEMSMPFIIRVMKVALRVLTPIVNVFGGILGPLGPIVIAGMAGISAFAPMLGGFMSQAASSADEQVDDEIAEMLSVTGLITHVDDLFGLLGAAIPGLDAHGRYPFDPDKMNEAFRHIEGFRR